jgi:hypothetical protein
MIEFQEMPYFLVALKPLGVQGQKGISHPRKINSTLNQFKSPRYQ